MASLPPPQDYKYQQFLNLLSPQENTKFRRHGVALFGLGRAGTIHLKNLTENMRVDILYVVEERESRRNEVKNLLNFKNTTFMGSENLESIWSDDRVEFVVITTPTQSHAHLILLALNNGKAVFCEKPLANTVEEIQQCYELAAKVGLPLLAAFNKRFDPSLENVQGRVQKGELGPVHIIKTCSRNSPKFLIAYLKTSDGIFLDCAIHDIDIISWILNEFPVKVFASGVANYPQIGAINDLDTVTIHLTFPSGAMALLDISRYANYGNDQRLEVFGPEGMLISGNQATLGVQTFSSKAVENSPIWFSFPSRFEDAYKRELDHFLNVLEGTEEISVTAEQTLNACRVALACAESVKTGIPVTVA